LIYIVYLVMLNAARDAVEKQKLPIDIGLWWVHGVFLLLALVLLFGGDGWRKLRSVNNRQRAVIAPGVK
jgi:lipopolysaccharide export system permease protein